MDHSMYRKYCIQEDSTYRQLHSKFPVCRFNLKRKKQTKTSHIVKMMTFDLGQKPTFNALNIDSLFLYLHYVIKCTTNSIFWDWFTVGMSYTAIAQNNDSKNDCEFHFGTSLNFFFFLITSTDTYSDCPKSSTNSH